MSNDITIKVPEAAIDEDLPKLAESARGLAVVDKESHGLALKIAKACKEKANFIESKFADPKKKAHAAHKSVCNLEAEALRPWQEIFKLADRKASDYEAAERRRAAEEAQRKEAEARKAEEDRRLKEAELAQQAGATAEQVDDLLDAPLLVPQVVPDMATAKVADVGSTTRWVGDVERCNLQVFVRWLALQPNTSGWWEQVELNTTALNNAARAFKGALAKEAPGLAAKEVSGHSYR